jgi:hypothetical protein
MIGLQKCRVGCAAGESVKVVVLVKNGVFQLSGGPLLTIQISFLSGHVKKCITQGCGLSVVIESCNSEALDKRHELGIC